MSKVVKRLLTFFIGIPIVLAIVFCDYLNHLPLQITLGIFAVLGANEFYNMLSKKGCVLFTREIVLIGTALTILLKRQETFKKPRKTSSFPSKMS